MATGGLSGNNAAAAIVLASKATTASSTDVVLNSQGDQVQAASNGNNNNNNSTSGPSFAMPLIPEAAVVQQNDFESSGVSGLTFSNSAPQVAPIKKTPSFGSNLRLTELGSLSPQVQLTSISGQPSPRDKEFQSKYGQTAKSSNNSSNSSTSTRHDVCFFQGEIEILRAACTSWF